MCQSGHIASTRSQSSQIEESSSIVEVQEALRIAHSSLNFTMS